MAFTEQALKQFTEEQLKSRLNTLTGMMIGLGVLEFIVFALAIYLVAGQGKTAMIALVAIPLTMTPIFLINVKNIKQLKEELAKRKE